MRTDEKLILLFILFAIGILLCGCAKKVESYKPPEEKRDVKVLVTDMHIYHN